MDSTKRSAMDKEDRRSLIGLIFGIAIASLIIIFLLYRVSPGEEVGNGTFYTHIDRSTLSQARWQIKCAAGDQMVISATIDKSIPGGLAFLLRMGVE